MLPKSSLLLCLVTITAILLHYGLENNSGFFFLIGSTIAIIVYEVYLLHKAQQWSKKPLLPPPPGTAHYNTIITPLYKALQQQQSALQRNQVLNQQIIEAANAIPAAVVVLDANYMIQWCNKGSLDLLKIDNAHDRGYSIFNYLRAPDFYRYVCETDWSTPYTCTKIRDDREFFFRLELFRYDEKNILLLCFDNTQFEKLRTTQQDFVANVSHELRTPLTVLMGFLETLREFPDDAISPDQRAHFEQLMQEQANRMLAIVSDLLTLSTLESTKLNEQEPVFVAELIEKAKEQVVALSQGQHHFSWTLDDTLSVKGNAHELSSAITNLLTNAVRYTPAEGNIDIFWGKNEEGQAVFSVKDSGLGIASSDLLRITERFYRVDKSRSRASGGTGLGLAITKHIAIRHNAKLKIKSKLNKGSTFSLVFHKENNE